MKKPVLVATFAGAVGALLLGFAAPASTQEAKPEAKPEAPAKAVLKAAKLDAAIELKAELNDTWQKAAPVTLTARKGKTSDVEVELRAAHDGTHLYLYARWADATQSLTKKAWLWGDNGWEKAKGDEDRISIAFNISAPAFDEKGCGGICHKEGMATAKEGELVDAWHWKAARGGLFGLVDDQHFAFSEDDGREDDDGDGASKKNETADGKAPARRWKDDADKNGPFNESTTAEIAADFKPEKGYTLPSNILKTPSGSRADVTCAAVHKDGFWTVVFKRKLDTGNNDDARLEAGKSVTFAVAAFDDCGEKDGKQHTKTMPATLTLE